MNGLLKKIFGNYSEKEIKKIKPLADKIESMESDFEKLNDTQLKAKTQEFKKRLASGESLDDILPEAFATVREASKRVLGMRHFYVQLIGGIVLHQGRIAEMKTGEGKTLVATLPAYLNALTGNGVHIVTVNDYLAKRDSEWMGKVYRFLGMEVGLVVHGMNKIEKKKAYMADITYGTNNEYGFDYLRDNMEIYKHDLRQRPLHFAILDEVDSILIDEARTPLIISGQGTKSTDLYSRANGFVRTLKSKVILESDDKTFDEDENYDYLVDEKAKSATLSTRGVEKAERYFGIENLSDPENIEVAHHINQALKANGIMKRDKDYIIKDGEVIIVDEFTGRLMYGRRYSDGLHQAIESKEGVEVRSESKTLATITFQNFFRMYKKLSGMTGTAETEEEEFRSIYDIDVIVIPTNKDVVRQDLPDVVFKSEKGKISAIIERIKDAHSNGQPVLVGTVTIEKSELISRFLKKTGIKHEVLNAKYHEKEAEIVAQAGRKGAVTIATNMAGRGTDIVLGGNPEFMAIKKLKKEGFEEHTINEAMGFADTDDAMILDAREKFNRYEKEFKEETKEEKKQVIESGGLLIIGTERHDSRRIDNQLRGRSGRQGDPGASQFYISLEDDLMRLFGSERLMSVVNALGMAEDQPIEHRILSNTIETSQRRVEGRNFSIRKNVLKYDDVMNAQREVVYSQRQKVLNGENIRENIFNMIRSIVDTTVDRFTGGDIPEDWHFEPMLETLESIFLPPNFLKIDNEFLEYIEKKELKEMFYNEALRLYELKEKEISSEIMRDVERVVLLKTVDKKWIDHLDSMEQLKQGISLRAYGQRDPVIEFKFESYDMFDEMSYSIQEETLKILFHTKLDKRPQLDKASTEMSAGAQVEKQKTIVNETKIGRNDPCPCGSGLKYKKCHGKKE